MICQKCGQEFQEKDIHESHDVPCYLFEGTDRKEKKKQADKHGRHLLCKKCHDMYELLVISKMVTVLTPEDKNKMIIEAKRFALNYFIGRPYESD